MSAVIETRGLGKRYRNHWALADCTLSVPKGRIVGLVGPNGAGKTTLLRLTTGLLAPTTGTIEVLGRRPASSAEQLAQVGFVAQETPTYANLSIADHLRMGAHLNPGWDDGFAQGRIAKLGLDRKQKAGRLSGGQRAQLALTMAIAKRPELLVLDEPVAALDPLARREFLEALLETVQGRGTTIVLSSHLVSDLELACDHLIVLAAGRVQVAGEVQRLLASHRMFTGPYSGGPTPLSGGRDVVSTRVADRRATVVAQAGGPDPELEPGWEAPPIDLEQLVLAYMTKAADERGARAETEARK